MSLNFPKAELHVHLEGTVSLPTLQSLARRNQIILEAPTDFPGYSPIPAPKLCEPFQGDFLEFIKRYVKISSCIKNRDDVIEIAEAYSQSAAAQNILHSEVYVTPTTLLALGCPKEELIFGLREAQEIAKQKHHTALVWIFDIVRNAPGNGFATVELASEFRDSGVAIIAVGLAGLEANYPALPFAEAFQEARMRGFRIFAHAGETAGAPSVWETLRTIKPERIGHGIRAMEDAKLVSTLREQKITLEVCPWSNFQLGVVNETTAHPLAQMLAEDLDIVLGADDPGIFGKTLNQNYLWAHEQGIPLDALRKLAQRSLELAQHTG